jgi:predicted MFS family arabinose efflux permease
MKHRATANPWRATIAGLCGSLVGIGLARFSYTPLLPSIIAAHWFSPADAAYLGAANLAGYLAGALLAAPLSTRLPAVWILRGMMSLATISFFTSSSPVDFMWFFSWRFVSGLAGGAIMVLAATTVLPQIAPSRRGLASGAIFMGVGLGISASGTLVPLLLRQGLTQTWIGLGALSALLTLVAWGGWPKQAAHQLPQQHARHTHHPRPSVRLRALYAEYALNAFGLVPHMIFLVDFVARGRDEGLDAGAQYWVLFGSGAIIGPLIGGYVGTRIGFGAALRLGYLLQAFAIVLPAIATLLLAGTPWDSWALILSSVIVGAFTPGIVSLVLGRVYELLEHHPAEHKAAWGRATVAFAVFQALGAYAMSFIFSKTDGNYALLFMTGAASLAVALFVHLVAGATERAITGRS